MTEKTQDLCYTMGQKVQVSFLSFWKFLSFLRAVSWEDWLPMEGSPCVQVKAAAKAYI